MEKQEWIDKYKAFVLENKGATASAYRFARFAGGDEEEFKDLFGSFQGLQSEVFTALFEETLDVLEDDASYAAYSVREKLLALYYTLFETLKTERDYLKCSLLPLSGFDAGGKALRKTQSLFEKYWEGLLAQGNETGEVPARNVLEKTYSPVLWQHFVFLLNYWLEDNSEESARTDAMVEKSVNTLMDVIGANMLDSLWDFGFYFFKEKFKGFAGFMP
jgi:hypothetical protein